MRNVLCVGRHDDGRYYITWFRVTSGIFAQIRHAHTFNLN